MRSLVVASILVAMTMPTFAQTKTTTPESTMTETQKGGPASKESKPNAGGQGTVTKGAGSTGSMPNAGNAGNASGAGGMAAPKK
jgi:hypothetical protein